MHLVISRYNESLDWLKQLNINFTIYNKGRDDINFNYINAPNQGREADTYIRYIIDNYDNLPEIIIFSQGYPFDHAPEFLQKIKTKAFDGIEFLGNQYFCCLPDGSPHDSGFNVNDIVLRLSLCKPRELFCFNTGAIFRVEKKLILRRRLDWWLLAHEVLLKENRGSWIYERLWPVIFKSN